MKRKLYKDFDAPDNKADHPLSSRSRTTYNHSHEKDDYQTFASKTREPVQYNSLLEPVSSSKTVSSEKTLFPNLSTSLGTNTGPIPSLSFGSHASCTTRCGNLISGNTNSFSGNIHENVLKRSLPQSKNSSILKRNVNKRSKFQNVSNYNSFEANKIDENSRSSSPSLANFDCDSLSKRGDSFSSFSNSGSLDEIRTYHFGSKSAKSNSKCRELNKSSKKLSTLSMTSKEPGIYFDKVTYSLSQKRKSFGLCDAKNIFVKEMKVSRKKAEEDDQEVREMFDTDRRSVGKIEMEIGVLEDEDSLLPVKITECYDSATDYMDTYYPLVRAESFSAIQKCINALYSDQLDEFIYHSVYVRGFCFVNQGFCLALKFTPRKPILNWNQEKSFLQSGNLLCLLPDGNCKDDHIWATVADRDVNLLKESSMIIVQLWTENNNITDAEAIIALLKSGGKTFMVESPTFFPTFQPVLKYLQNFDKECFPLYNQIVKYESRNEAPDYLSDSTWLLPTCVFPAEKDFIDKIDFLNMLNDENEECILDKSQAKAVAYALSHRVAVIQGPPGCGKTLVGSKLIEIILSCKPQVSGPILVVTYKNHALDEFLIHTLNFLDKKDIVRIGGMSAEEKLEECNLVELSKNCPKSKSIRKCLLNVKDNIEKISKRIRFEADNLHLYSQMTPELFLQELSKEQLNLLWENAEPKKMKSHLFKNLIRTTTVLDKNLMTELIKKWWPDSSKLKLSREIEARSEESVNQEKTKESEMKLNLWSPSKSDHVINMEDLFAGMQNNSSIVKSKDLWKLTQVQRMQLLASVMKDKVDYHCKRLDKLLKKLKKFCENQIVSNNAHKIKQLQTKKLIGMTITGANIHRSLIKKICPKVVIVEEAAEILEPLLIASLPIEIEHLIMIGDHQQLQPKLDSQKLKRKYKFHYSMMQRIIESNKYPYETLTRQSRMRHEFAELLRDIYPELESNNSVIQSNYPPKCMEKSMFFWTHEEEEDASERSNSNTEEISRIKYLTLFLIQSGCEASEITVLAAYRNQVVKLREEIWDNEACFDVVINTIDNYQGDENKYVIISLVRSNSEGEIGFLIERNRRCVAQSRAKCGMYFIGNKYMFTERSIWKPLMKKMKGKKCIGSKLGIQCEKHGAKSIKYVENARELQKICDQPTVLCLLPCGVKLSSYDHICKFPCKSHFHLTESQLEQRRRKLPSVDGMKKTTIFPSRKGNPSDPYRLMYEYAEERFFKTHSMRGELSKKFQIEKIDILQNEHLEELFKKKRKEFKIAGISHIITEAFHGTDSKNVDNILENNLLSSYAKRQMYGEGNYFSEFPDVSLEYGNGVLLCDLLYGKKYKCHKGQEIDYPGNFNCKLVKSNPMLQNSSEIVVIRDSDQILPKCFIHVIKCN